MICWLGLTHLWSRKCLKEDIHSLVFTHRQEEHAVHPKRGVAGVEGEPGEERDRQIGVRMVGGQDPG